MFTKTINTVLKVLRRRRRRRIAISRSLFRDTIHLGSLPSASSTVEVASFS
jgi:hypothetical protein